jgi:hypothetical protein
MKADDLVLGTTYQIVDSTMLCVLTNFYSKKLFVKYHLVRGGRKSRKGIIVRTEIFCNSVRSYEDRTATQKGKVKPYEKALP